MSEEKTCRKRQDYDFEFFEGICKESWESVYRFVYYRVQNREEAEDITQEAYARALAHVKKGSRIEKYVYYLKTVSLNILRDGWRKKKLGGECVSFDDMEFAGPVIDDPAEVSAQRSLIEAALEKLSKEQQIVIKLRIMKGYSVRDAARLMNIKEGAVRVLQYRALKALSSIIGQTCDGG